MQKLKHISLVLAVLLTCMAFRSPLGGYKYSPQEGKCSIVFPGEIEESETKKESYKTIKAQYTSNEQTLFFSYTLHDLVLDDTDGELNKVSKESFMGALKAKVSQESDWVIKKQKQKGLSAKFSMDNQNTIGEYRVFVHGNIQYQIVAIAQKSNYDDKMIDKFFKSFRVLN